MKLRMETCIDSPHFFINDRERDVLGLSVKRT